MKLATHRNLVELGLAAAIMVAALLALLVHQRKVMTARSEVVIVNELDHPVTLLDLTRNDVVAAVPASGRWPHDMALGSHDDGSSFTTYRFARADGTFADVSSMDLYLTRVRIHPQGIDLLKHDATVGLSLEWVNGTSRHDRAGAVPAVAPVTVPVGS